MRSRPVDMRTESATRKEIIDLRLTEAGWCVADRTQVIEEYFVSPPNHGGEVAKPGLEPFSNYRRLF